jgi:hypothetical protein
VGRKGAEMWIEIGAVLILLFIIALILYRMTRE